MSCVGRVGAWVVLRVGEAGERGGIPSYIHKKRSWEALRAMISQCEDPERLEWPTFSGQPASNPESEPSKQEQTGKGKGKKSKKNKPMGQNRAPKAAGQKSKLGEGLACGVLVSSHWLIFQAGFIFPLGLFGHEKGDAKALRDKEQGKKALAFRSHRVGRFFRRFFIFPFLARHAREDKGQGRRAPIGDGERGRGKARGRWQQDGEEPKGKRVFALWLLIG